MIHGVLLRRLSFPLADVLTKQFISRMCTGLATTFPVRVDTASPRLRRAVHGRQSAGRPRPESDGLTRSGSWTRNPSVSAFLSLKWTSTLMNSDLLEGTTMVGELDDRKQRKCLRTRKTLPCLTGEPVVKLAELSHCRKEYESQSHSERAGQKPAEICSYPDTS